MHPRFHGFIAALLVLGLGAFSACAPDGSGTSSGQTIVIGSQDYYSNEIIAEIYAQVLESAGYKVDRQFRIGQREVYLPEIEQGKIDLFPEYSGPLLQYFQSSTNAKKPDEVYAELKAAMPGGLRVLEQSPATDQDSYVVTAEFASKWGLVTIADLAKVTSGLTLGANSEAQTRPNGPTGLKKAYGIEAAFTPIEDGGGPLTVKALKDDEIQLAIIYTADPSIATNNLVSLVDTNGLFLASHVVPVASGNIDSRAAAIIDRVSAAMTGAVLIELNARSVSEQLPAKTIASDWIALRGLK
ncbi:MAG: ABC transporter substrate-binding protein [Propionibacteriaceae bacterium]|nr:ABC transporter substrate-binding protein [Propionibacteriaceae bacterium]